MAASGKSSSARGMEDSDVRTDDGVLHLLEPLLPMYPQNARDVNQPQQDESNPLVTLESLSHQLRPSAFVKPKSVRGSSSSPDPEKAGPSGGARESCGGRNLRSNAPVTEGRVSEISEISESPSSQMAESPSMSNLRRKVEQWAEERVSEGGEIQHEDGVSRMEMMQLKLEAMTWAALAKDFIINSLKKRLRNALHTAKDGQMKNQELKKSIDEARIRETAMTERFVEAKNFIDKLRNAEDRLSQLVSEIEVDASEHERQHRAQVAKLMDRIKAQDDYIARSLTNAESVWEGRGVEQLEQELSRSQETEKDLSEKLELADQQIERMRDELSIAHIDLQVSEVMRKTQSRRLKVLEKERRYFMRKGALRSVKLAPKSLLKRHEPPGGPAAQGWNVFSVLELSS